MNLSSDSSFFQLITNELTTIIKQDNTDRIIPIIVLLAEIILQNDGLNASISFLSIYVSKYKNIHIIKNLVHCYAAQSNGHVKNQLTTLDNTLSQFLLKCFEYQCGSCGFHTNTFFWECIACKKWGSIEYTGFYNET